MKKVTAYKCDKCDKLFLDEEFAQRHEALHEAKFIEVSLFLNIDSNELWFGRPYVLKSRIENASPVRGVWVGSPNDPVDIEWKMDCENTPEAIEATRHILRIAVTNWANLLASDATNGRIKDLNKKEND